MKNTKTSEPGYFVNESALIIETFEATTLINGQNFDLESGKNVRIPDLKGFSVMLTKMWSAAKNDDPYAVKAILEVERLIERAEVILKDIENSVDRKRRIKKIPDGLQINSYKSEKAVKIEVHDNLLKATQTALLLILIANYDALVLKIKTNKKFGILTSKQAKIYKDRATTVVRAVLFSSIQYKRFGITREDIRNKSDQGVKAINHYGLIELSILNNEIQPKYGPTVN